MAPPWMTPTMKLFFTGSPFWSKRMGPATPRYSGEPPSRPTPSR